MSLSSLIWSVAELLRGDDRQSDDGKAILPYTVLRRLDCVLGPPSRPSLGDYDPRSESALTPSGSCCANTAPDYMTPQPPQTQVR